MRHGKANPPPLISPDVLGQSSLQRRSSLRNGGKVGSADVQLVVVFQQQGPLGGIQSRGVVGGLDHVDVAA